MPYEADDLYIKRVLEGDTSSYASLVNKHKTMVFNIALRILKNREDAEEIAQDTFLKVFHALREFKGESKFSTWLYRIVYNLAISKIRKKKYDVASYDDENFEWMEPADSFNSAMRLSQNEQKNIINSVLSRLHGEDAALVTLFYMNENTLEEISGITGLGLSNVKVKLFRARKKMFEELQHLLKEETADII